MSEAKFTKGEWKIHADKIGVIDKSDTQSNGMMQEVCWIEEIFYSSLESKANAYLIATAPEMYEDIERDIQWLEQMKSKFVLGSYEYRSICLRIEAKQKLLSKARGEPTE